MWFTIYMEKGMTTHSNILAWEIPWTEEPGGLQSMGLQQSWTRFMTKQQYILYTYIYNRHNTQQYRQENMGYEPWKWH